MLQISIFFVKTVKQKFISKALFPNKAALICIDFQFFCSDA